MVLNIFNNYKRVIKRQLFIFIGILIAIVGIILSNTYRPYIYQNNLYDFHLADTIGSLLCVPAATFLFRGISIKYSFNQFIIITTIGNILYEFLGLLKIQRVLDYYDVIAIFIGASATYLIGVWCKIDR